MFKIGAGNRNLSPDMEATTLPPSIEVADSSCVDELSSAVNFGERQGVDVPDMLLLHYTGMDSAEGALHWLCCEESGVSCHYFVFEDGRIVQLLPESVRAHHAGVSCWQGERDINSRSIGIEIANPGHSISPLPTFPKVQMQAVLRLCQDIVARNHIVPERVLGHSDVAPGRKQDPGENFDWGFLAAHGVGHFVEPAATSQGPVLGPGDIGPQVEALQANLARYGYDIEPNEEYDDWTATVVTAFQRHFRPKRVDGLADSSTLETMDKLLNSRSGGETA